MRIGLLNNLRAGRNDRQVADLLNSLNDFAEVSHIETSSAGAVPDALWDFAHDDVELLLVNGGDGTLQAVLTEILESRAFDDRVPLVAPLRGGRTNMTALDLGAQRSSVLAVAQLVDAARRGTLSERILERRVLRVEQGVRGKVQYGMFFGGGTICRAIELVHRGFPKGRAQGVFGATVVTGALLGRLAVGAGEGDILRPDKARLKLDGQLVEGDRFTLMMACTLERLFAGIRPFWGEGKGGVRFTSLRAEAEQLWRAVPRILTGRPGGIVSEANGYASRNAERADLLMDCGFTVDGELMEQPPGGALSVTADSVVRFVRA